MSVVLILKKFQFSFSDVNAEPTIPEDDHNRLSANSFEGSCLSSVITKETDSQQSLSEVELSSTPTSHNSNSSSRNAITNPFKRYAEQLVKRNKRKRQSMKGNSNGFRILAVST